MGEQRGSWGCQAGPLLELPWPAGAAARRQQAEQPKSQKCILSRFGGLMSEIKVSGGCIPPEASLLSWLMATIFVCPYMVILVHSNVLFI